MYSRVLQISIFFFFSLIAVSCSHTKKAGRQDDKAGIADRQNDTDKIVFLTLRISRDSIHDKNVVEMVNISRQAGKLKADSKTPVEHDNYLAIEIYERDSLIKLLMIQHPLYKHVEFQDKDKKLSKKEVILNTEEFFIRFQMKGNTGKVKIMEKRRYKDQKELTTINL